MSRQYLLTIQATDEPEPTEYDLHYSKAVGPGVVLSVVTHPTHRPDRPILLLTDLNISKKVTPEFLEFIDSQPNLVAGGMADTLKSGGLVWEWGVIGENVGLSAATILAMYISAQFEGRIW